MSELEQFKADLAEVAARKQAFLDAQQALLTEQKRKSLEAALHKAMSEAYDHWEAASAALQKTYGLTTIQGDL